MMGIHEKGSGDVFSAVLYIIYSIHLSFWTQTAEKTSSELFSSIRLYVRELRWYVVETLV